MEPIAMVGRADEIGELNRAWRRLTTDHLHATSPAVAVITGPVGIGKTRLVSAATAGLDPAPASIHLGVARLHSPAPYDWLAAVLSRRAVDERSEEQLEISVPADALAWLRQDLAVPRERFAPEALLRIAVRVVRALVGAGPSVLVVEDLHALDPASLNLIAALATTPLPALLVVTSRPPEAPLVADVLARLAGTPSVIRQHLAPLDRSAVTAALTSSYGVDDLPAGAVETALARTGGNPFQLTELLATTRSVGALESEPPDLTARELDVLACLAGGMSNQQVASSLGISIRTVTVHVSNLLRKTRSRSRTDAALWAMRHGISHSSVTTTSS
jgi:DNA-binding CsgD family transcriptional regulator